MKSLFGFFNSSEFNELHNTGKYKTFYEFSVTRYNHLISHSKYSDNSMIKPINAIVTKDILAMIESVEIHFTLDNFNYEQVYAEKYDSTYTLWELWLCLNIDEFFDKVIFYNLPVNPSWYMLITLSDEDKTLLIKSYEDICNFRNKYGLGF